MSATLTAIAVAGTGLLGVVVGAALAGRNQQNQLWSERMVAAADDFAASASAAYDGFLTALTRPHLADEKMREVERLVHEASLRQLRVELVFHPDSEAAAKARHAAGELRATRREMSLYFSSDEDAKSANFAGMWSRCEAALDAIRDFVREAAWAARRPSRRRLRPPRDRTVFIESPEPQTVPSRTSATPPARHD